MPITYFFFTVLQVEETDFDRLHSEQQTQGENKYSTIQKVCTYLFVNLQNQCRWSGWDLVSTGSAGEGGYPWRQKLPKRMKKKCWNVHVFVSWGVRGGSFSKFFMNIEEDKNYELFSTFELIKFWRPNTYPEYKSGVPWKPWSAHSNLPTFYLRFLPMRKLLPELRVADLVQYLGPVSSTQNVIINVSYKRGFYPEFC